MNWILYTATSGYRDWILQLPNMTISIEEWSRPKGSCWYSRGPSREQDEKKGNEFGYTAPGTLAYFNTLEKAMKHTEKHLRAILKELHKILDEKTSL